MGWRSYNDRLALLMVLGIPGMWLYQAVSGHALPGEVNGALIATWTLVVQYYFRRAPPGANGGAPP